MFFTQKKFFIIPVAIAVLVAGTLFADHTARAASFTVNSLLDTVDVNPGDGICDDGSGNCTLRAAIAEANATIGADTITISVNGVTSPTTQYPQIMETVSIIGPGPSNFEIDASGVDEHRIFNSNNVAGSSFSGFKLSNVYEIGFHFGQTDNTSWSNFEITGRGIDTGWALLELGPSDNYSITNCSLSEGGLGVRIVGSTNATVDSCTVTGSQHSGLTSYDSSYTTFRNNTISNVGDFGMFIIFGSDHALIENNTISGSGIGAITMGLLGADNGTVSDNIIRGNTLSTSGGPGLTLDEFVENTTIVGNRILNNHDAGIYVSGTNTTIGGTGPSDFNVIGNNGGGIMTWNATTVTILGNFIGVDSDGTTAMANDSGIQFSNGTGAFIGGANAGEGNVISNSVHMGISIDGTSTVSIKGNRIGVTADGETDAGNNGQGVFLKNATGVTIGGTTASERNIISGNTNQGIYGDNITTAVIKGNYIGTDDDGAVAIGNGQQGIQFENSTDVTIGGPNAGDGNVISGNTINEGIQMSDVSNVVIQGNYIGLDATGLNLITNDSGIVFGNVSNATIGGTSATSRNYIVNQDGNGIKVDGVAINTAVIGNYVGLNTAGAVTGSLHTGIYVSSEFDGATSIIGGVNAGEGNVVAGVTFDGFAFGIQLEATTNVRVYGNKIGTNAAGVAAPGYGNTIGIAMLMGSGVGNNKIGGIESGQGNVIAGNTMGGVFVLGVAGSFTTRNSILGNSIFANNGVGIDLLDFDGVSLINQGPNTNDAGDGDTGPNDLLNAPVITSVNTTSGVVTYKLDVPAGDYRVEFFKNPISGTYGEGQIYLGYDEYTSTGSESSDTVTLSLSEGDFITAVVTEQFSPTTFGSSSEFSQAYGTSGESAPAPVGGGVISVQKVCNDPRAINYTTGVGIGDKKVCTYKLDNSKEPSIETPDATTSQEAQETQETACPAFSGYYRKGSVGEEIKKIQLFLNKEVDARLPITGVFGAATDAAVKKFQQKYFDLIITPWETSQNVTGYWYKTTRMKANQLSGCTETPVVLETNGKTWVLPLSR